MSNYDYEMDFSSYSSTGIIFNKIDRKSTVLEFGCANGRMTRAMKAVLDCKVYIVEHSQGAYDEAICFAEDGICDDIQTYSWYEKFKDIKFDFILFVDVLEHLTLAEDVLKKAAKLLSEDGKVLISIPNLTHNDVIIKQVNDSIDYLDYGLLDSTHVHFWGLNNLEPLAKYCGLQLNKVEGTYKQTGTTEQACDLDNVLIEDALRQRKCGDIYQFIITMSKEKVEGNVYELLSPTVNSHIYIDTGNDFNAQECITFQSQLVDKDTYNAHYVLSDVDNVSRIRFDPIEKQPCKLNRISIMQGMDETELEFSNHIQKDDNIIFLDDDPMIVSKEIVGSASVVIDAVFEVGEKYIDSVVSGLINTRKSLTQYTEELIVKDSEITKYRQDMEKALAAKEYENASLKEEMEKNTVAKNNEINILKDKELKNKETIEQLERKNRENKHRISALENDCKSLKRENEKNKNEVIGLQEMIRASKACELDLRVLLSKKEMILAQKNTKLIDNEESLSRIEAILQEKERILTEKDNLIQAHERQLGYYRSLWYTKFRHFIGEIYRKMRAAKNDF